MKKIAIASDHAGHLLKEELKKNSPYEWKDLGVSTDKEKSDYPDQADLLCKYLKKNPEQKGVLICGSGQGMVMRANRYPFVRACLCWDEKTAFMSRSHNDANVLCLGARFLKKEDCFAILKTFMETSFEKGRHERRVKKLEQDTL